MQLLTNSWIFIILYYRMISFDLKLISKYRGCLMGIAMLSILLGHYHGLSECSHWKITDMLCSVLPGLFMSETFLFLSGFGLYYAYTKKKSFVDFYKRRVNRLLLPFLLMSLPFFIYEFTVGNISMLQFIGNISTLSFWVEGNYYSMWYIAVSVFLYAIFPIIYRIMFSGKNVGLRFVSFLLVIYSLISFLNTIRQIISILSQLVYLRFQLLLLVLYLVTYHVQIIANGVSIRFSFSYCYR